MTDEYERARQALQQAFAEDERRAQKQEDTVVLAVGVAGLVGIGLGAGLAARDISTQPPLPVTAALPNPCGPAQAEPGADRMQVESFTDRQGRRVTTNHAALTGGKPAGRGRGR